MGVDTAESWVLMLRSHDCCCCAVIAEEVGESCVLTLRGLAVDAEESWLLMLCSHC